MPIFEYQCRSCKATYDIYHKVKEIEEDVICPECQSKEHKRLMSVSQFSMSGSSGADYSSAPSCESGGCCGGSCGVN